MTGGPPSDGPHLQTPRAPSDAAGRSPGASASAAPSPVVVDFTTSRRMLAFGVLLLAEFFYGWAWNTIDVLRPFLRASLGLSLMQAGSGYSAQGAGALIGAVVLGQLADRLDRRNVLAAMMVGIGALMLAGAAVRTYPEFLAQRFVLGLFMGGVGPVGVSIYVTLFQPRLRGKLAGTMNASFSAAIVTLGLALGTVGEGGWRQLFVGGAVPALAIAVAVMLLCPSIRTAPGAVRMGRLPVLELLAPGLRRQTLMLAAMTGLNFFGYQAFNGWLTTYLTSSRHLSAAAAGGLVSWQFAGNIIGGFAWGWASDRLGRRFNALGFIIAAIAIAGFILAPTDLPLLRAIGFVYGATLCSSVVWGPWLAELYPAHLRSTAASIFNWGRIISFFAPLVTATLAERFGLPAAMLAGATSFLAAAVIWVLQPETLSRRRPADRRGPLAVAP